MSGVGITFDETHSFRDWGLKLKKIEIGIPKAKTEYVSVPGMNGDLDLTEAQNGGIKYEMRELKFTFGVCIILHNILQCPEYVDQVSNETWRSGSDSVGSKSSRRVPE